MNFRVAVALIGSALSASAAGAPTATPTPTPPPRLSGGFGRAAATPVSRAASGQSLQDVVRAAKDGRPNKETPRPGVSITNQSLVTDPNRGRLTTWQAATRAPGQPASAAKGASVAATPIPTATPAPPDAAVGEEARWREIAQQTRERVARGREDVTRLDAETKRLENDFYAWDDGLYRDNVIKPAWDKKREELETARRELEEAEKDLADLPERARKAGALPGWIRE